MPRELTNMVKKELREIFRDPRLFLGIIVVPILILPLMGGGIRIATESTASQIAAMEVGLANVDAQTGNRSMGDLFYALMVQNEINVRNSTAVDADTGVPWMKANGIATLVILPGNFTEAILAGHSGDVKVFQTLTSFGFTDVAGSQRVESVVAQFNALVTARRLSGQFPGSAAGELLTPARATENSVIRGVPRAVRLQDVINAVLGTSLTIPIAVAIMVMLAAQLAGTTVAMEKEQKTLEVLLTLPIRRTNILLGKLVGVVLVSGIATVAMLVSYGYYMQGFTSMGSASTVDLSAVGLAPEPLGYALLAVSLFLSIVAAMALAVLLAAYTKDVRSANSLMGILFLPILIPAFILMFAPVNILPLGLQVVICALPFSYSTIAAQAMYTKDYLVVGLGILYQVAFTAVVLYIAARFFASEKVLTARLRFGKAKRGPMQD
jgi:ABC-2 type transport system permease protein